MTFPGLFHAWGKQIIAGIGWDLITDTVKLDGGELPDFSKPTGKNHPKYQVRINPDSYVLLAKEKCREANVQQRFYETLLELSMVELKKILIGKSVIITEV